MSTSSTVNHSAEYYIAKGFLSHLEFLSSDLLLTEKEIAEKVIPSKFDRSVRSLRAVKAIAKAQVREEDRGIASRLNREGHSVSSIADLMELSESTIRTYLKEA